MGGDGQALVQRRLKSFPLRLTKPKARTKCWKVTMKDLYEVLERKKMEIERVRREIEALHFVIPLLAEDADWVELGLASPRSASQFRASGPAIAKAWPRTQHQSMR